MQLVITIDPSNTQSVSELLKLANTLSGTKAPQPTQAAATKKAPVKAKTVVIEEEPIEEEVDFEASEETYEEEIVDEEIIDDSEPDFNDEEVIEEEEIVAAPPAKKAPVKAAAPATKAAPAKAPTIKLETVIAEFQAAHKRLTVKLKSKEKAQAKLNGVIKANGGKNTRTLDAKVYGKVIKELKALQG